MTAQGLQTVYVHGHATEPLSEEQRAKAECAWPLPRQARQWALRRARAWSYSVLDDQSLMGNWMNSLYCLTRLPSLPASASSTASSFRCSVMRVPRGRSAASSSRTCAPAHHVTQPLTTRPDLAQNWVLWR